MEQRFKFICSVFLCGIIAQLVENVNSANILFYHSAGTYSHRVQHIPLALALADRGHKVTFISPFSSKDPINHPNLTEIVPSSIVPMMTKFLKSGFNLQRRTDKTSPRLMYDFYDVVGLKSCDLILTSPEVQEFFKDIPHLDLVFLSNCVSECGLAIVHKYKAKHIFYHLLTITGNEPDFYGFTPESGSIPMTDFLSPKTPLTFFDRVDNTLNFVRHRWSHYQYMVKLDSVIRTVMDVPDMPFLDDLGRNASLIFHAGDIVTDFSRALPPNVINVGGTHCKKGNGALPDDILQFLRNSQTKDGINDFVYISLGSALQPAALPDKIKQAFFKTMEAFPNLKFLWKWSGDTPEHIPNNLFLSSWFPQNEILAHPKLKAFMTQSGRPSMYESLCHAVPMIAFPVVTDQDNNAHKMNLMGGNVVLELDVVTTEQLVDAVKKVVQDNRFKERMLELQTIFYDQPMTSLETAVWWTEYVLRHDDLSHLRPAGFDQTWYQRRLLDVWLFLFTGILVTGTVVILGVVWVLKIMLKKCRHEKRKTE